MNKINQILLYIITILCTKILPKKIATKILYRFYTIKGTILVGVDSKTNAIGFEGDLLYRIKEDMKFFKNTTIQANIVNKENNDTGYKHPLSLLICGGNTYTSFNAPYLPNRDMIVISSSIYDKKLNYILENRNKKHNCLFKSNIKLFSAELVTFYGDKTVVVYCYHNITENIMFNVIFIRTGDECDIIANQVKDSKDDTRISKIQPSTMLLTIIQSCRSRCGSLVNKHKVFVIGGEKVYNRFMEFSSYKNTMFKVDSAMVTMFNFNNIPLRYDATFDLKKLTDIGLKVKLSKKLDGCDHIVDHYKL